MKGLKMAAAMLAIVLWALPAAADYKAGATAYTDGDFKTAFREFLNSANDGDARAEFALGVMYHKGKGVPKDYAKAMEWYSKAAEKGHPVAQNNLGIMFRRGEGVQKDPREAFTWIWMAAMQGNARAQFNLSDMYMHGEGVAKDPVQAYAWLEFAVTDLSGGGRQMAVDRRNRIIAMLDPDDVARAERMAKAFRAAHN